MAYARQFEYDGATPCRHDTAKYPFELFLDMSRRSEKPREETILIANVRQRRGCKRMRMPAITGVYHA